ncbi:MAG: winged helix-turn-helix domain-containing protein [Cyanobacteriota bacterium]
MSADPRDIQRQPPPEAWLLLIGERALAQQPRLELSGYGCLRENDADTRGASDGSSPPEDGQPPEPALLLLSADQAGRIGSLRQHWPGCPILLDSETDSIETRTHCLTAGADDFWLSDLGASDLLGRLRVHLKLVARQARRPVCLRLADLEIDPARHQVRRGQRRVALTSREYSLLLLLLQNVGQVVSRDTILATIWSDQQGTASNVIEVYVRYLRQKLEEDGERRLIHTVRGAGYCLSERPPGQEGVTAGARLR